MTKKRLSDLLKEEVQKEEGQKPAETEAAQSDTPQPAAAKPAKARTAPSRRTTGRRTSSAAAKPEAAAPEAPSTPDAAPAAPAQAEADAGLDAKIAELEQALQQAQAREAALQKQVNGLLEDLGKQQDRLFELKDQMEKATAEAEAKTGQLNQVTTELEAAKKDILKMTEANSQPAPTRRRLGADIVDRQRYGPRPPSAQIKPLPSAAQEGAANNSMLSNDEIGWVD